VGGFDDLLRQSGIGDAGQDDIEGGSDAEAAVLGGHQVDPGIDRDLAEVHLLAAGDRLEGTFEAGGVADREELLGIGAGLFVSGRAQIDFEGTVLSHSVAVYPASGHVSLCGVDYFSGHFQSLPLDG